MPPKTPLLIFFKSSVPREKISLYNGQVKISSKIPNQFKLLFSETKKTHRFLVPNTPGNTPELWVNTIQTVINNLTITNNIDDNDDESDMEPLPVTTNYNNSPKQLKKMRESIIRRPSDPLLMDFIKLLDGKFFNLKIIFILEFPFD